jgi:DNA replication protein DnaC
MHHVPSLLSLKGSTSEAKPPPIGVRLRGVRRPNGGIDANEDLLERRPVHIPGLMHTPGGLYQSGKARLEEIARKVDSSSGDALASSWLDAVRTSMQHKASLYAEEGRKLNEEIVDQQRKLNEFVRGARQTEERVAQPDPGRTNRRPSEAPPREDNALAQWHQTNKWDLISDRNDRWATLVAQKAAFKEIEQAARQRGAQASASSSSTASTDLRRRLARAVRELAAYDAQPLLLESMADLIDAFIKSPLVAQNSFVSFILAGDPGVGKTRLAGAIGTLLSRLGMYVYENVVECGRSDLVAEFMGQTAPKTRTFLLANLEKVVFLDEAYALTSWFDRTNGTGRILDAYSAEAVTEIVAFLSQYVGRSCLIAAGYEAQMMADFLPANEGLSRRFSYIIVMQPYHPEYMVKIFTKALAKALSTDAQELTTHAVRDFFTIPALVFLEDVITDSRSQTDGNPTFPMLHKLFAPQAGAMVNLANVAAVLIASSEAGLRSIGIRSEGESWAVGFLDMHDLLITQLQQHFPDTYAGWHAAARELSQIGINNGWIHQGHWVASQNAKERMAAHTAEVLAEETGSELSDASVQRRSRRLRGR